MTSSAEGAAELNPARDVSDFLRAMPNGRPAVYFQPAAARRESVVV
jgi:hypothetical protein